MKLKYLLLCFFIGLIGCASKNVENFDQLPSKKDTPKAREKLMDPCMKMEIMRIDHLKKH